MPSDPPLRLRLDDGTPVLLRPLRPEDAHFLEEGLARLSSASRITRFFAPIAQLSPDQLAYLTDVDQHDHVAWGALDTSLEKPLGIGVGRFARLPDEPHVAEVAVAVIDDYQRHGLGGLLLGVLYALARVHDIEVLRAFVLPQNPGLAERLHALGGEIRHEAGMDTIDVPVHADLARLPDTPEAEHLRDVLRQIEAARATPRTTRSRRRGGGRS